MKKKHGKNKDSARETKERTEEEGSEEEDAGRRIRWRNPRRRKNEGGKGISTKIKLEALTTALR